MTAVASVMTNIKSILTAIERTDDQYRENIMTAIVSKEMVCLLISQLVEIMVKHLLLIVSVKPLRFMDT
ncbi:hypothetical protein AC790_18680 [Pantoea sp. RIT-PI-b]|nr:hypothetical protein AC790_18680 [Pantoea sp. RIT-PI-b]